MTTAAPSITDSELQREVEQELRWDPSVAPASIGVSASDHTVSLSGTVYSYSSHLAAVGAAKRVKGVRAIADDIVVDIVVESTPGHTDHEIAEFAEHAMEWSTSVPSTVRATVRDGVLTLDGEVDWDFQRRAAKLAVTHIAGIRNLIDDIVLKPVPSAHDVHDRIATALRRAADVDATNIHVTSNAGHVTLTGSASSWAERERVQHTAWSAPGVTNVSDNLVIR